MNDKIVRATKATAAAGCLTSAYAFGHFMVRTGFHPVISAIFAGLAITGAVLGKQAIFGYEKETTDGNF